eukprot:TRINITY_DN18017_c0_g1_i5.p1 TRINITY_DN18017_c0_g1~~TRINITY_DN18017_c0_g1_i5.p1  ORF type:complete len:468 (+),score=121.72 TRINITY_DN18017_c0_g1_i5:53-1456(+)
MVDIQNLERHGAYHLAMDFLKDINDKKTETVRYSSATIIKSLSEKLGKKIKVPWMEAMLEKNKLLFKNLGRSKESVWGNVSTVPEFKNNVLLVGENVVTISFDIPFKPEVNLPIHFGSKKSSVYISNIKGIAVKTEKKKSYFAVIPVQEKKAAAIFFQTEKGIQLPKDEVRFEIKISLNAKKNIIATVSQVNDNLTKEFLMGHVPPLRYYIDKVKEVSLIGNLSSVDTGANNSSSTQKTLVDEEVFISDSDHEYVEAKGEPQKQRKEKKRSKDDEKVISKKGPDVQTKPKDPYQEKKYDHWAITEQMKKIDLNDNFSITDSESSVKQEFSSYFDKTYEHQMGHDPDKVFLNDENVLRRSTGSIEKGFPRKLKSGQSLTSRETLDSENSNPDVRIVSGWKTSKGNKLVFTEAPVKCLQWKETSEHLSDGLKEVEIEIRGKIVLRPGEKLLAVNDFVANVMTCSASGAQ